MKEIDKLRMRLEHINKNITEYKMSVEDARRLLAEFEDLENNFEEKVKMEIENREPIVMVHNLDGGGFI